MLYKQEKDIVRCFNTVKIDNNNINTLITYKSVIDKNSENIITKENNFLLEGDYSIVDVIINCNMGIIIYVENDIDILPVYGNNNKLYGVKLIDFSEMMIKEVDILPEVPLHLRNICISEFVEMSRKGLVFTDKFDTIIGAKFSGFAELYLKKEFGHTSVIIDKVNKVMELKDYFLSTFTIKTHKEKIDKGVIYQYEYVYS